MRRGATSEVRVPEPNEACEALDRQHEDLVRLVELAADAAASRTAEEARAALGVFMQAFVRHAAHEEALMEESLFPERRTHAAAHEAFLAEVQLLADDLARPGQAPRVAEGLRMRVGEWLRFHVGVNDAKLCAHLTQVRPGTRGRGRGSPRT